MAFVMSMLSLLAAIVAYVGYRISQKAVRRSRKNRTGDTHRKA
ncbi:hypothetical protein [Weissella confusa]|nr:hypothetical protein [Weissella confusa]